MRIKNKVTWLFLFVAALTVTLFLQPTLSQASTDLTLILKPDYNNGVTAGKDNILFLEIKNSGTQTITNIRLSADQPEGWNIEFTPDYIESLSPRSLQTVTINIRPPTNAIRGYQTINIIATANEITKAESLYINVKKASFWIWIIIGVSLVIVAIFIYVFMRLNRQK